ncbi:MAG: hypothetical protein ABFC96_05600, partial [Thermoguttaceae bacterium]
MRRCLLALLLVVATPGFGAENATTDAVRFHRLMVPEDRAADWPTGGAKYLPMDAEEFERLIEAGKPPAARTPSPPEASIAASDYGARLLGARLVGRADFDVVHIGRKPSLLSLDPCSLAV